MKKYKGHSVIKSKLQYIIIGNDDTMQYELINTKNNDLIIWNEAEDVCLEFMNKLNGDSEHDNALIVEKYRNMSNL